MTDYADFFNFGEAEREAWPTLTPQERACYLVTFIVHGMTFCADQDPATIVERVVMACFHDADDFDDVYARLRQKGLLISGDTTAWHDGPHPDTKFKFPE